jgi:WD40 repeat protein
MMAMPPLTALLLAASLVQPVHTDRYGDPLPAGAVARLGSLRLYHDGGDIQQLQFSPDGKVLASRNASGWRLWDAASGRRLPLRDEIGRAARLFPVEGKLLAAECLSSTLRLWDVTTGREVRRLTLDLRNKVFGIAPDGRTLVWAETGIDRSLLGFYDLLTETVSEPADPWEMPKLLQQVTFSADGRTLALLYIGGRIDVWDVPAHRLRRSWSGVGGRGQLMRFALSPDGKLVARAGGGGRTVRLWDSHTGREEGPLDAQGARGLTMLAFSPDGKQLAACYEAGWLRLWDLTDPRRTRWLRGVAQVAFSGDGSRLAGAAGSGITLWELPGGRPCHDFGHAYAVGSVVFSPDGGTIASGAPFTDPLVRLWDARTGAQKAQGHGHDAGIGSIAIAPDGRLLASGSQDGTVRLWEAGTAKEVDRLDTHDGMVLALGFSPDGKQLAAGGQSKAVHLLDVATSQELRAFGTSSRLVVRLAYSPDGKLLGTLDSGERIVRLWDSAAGAEVRELGGDSADVNDFAFSPDGALLAMSSSDGSIRVFDVASGRLQRECALPPARRLGGVYGLCFSPDGRMLAAGYDDSSVRLWEVISGQERSSLEGHRNAVLCVAFSPDGRRLASGSGDRTILVWDVMREPESGWPNPSIRELASWWEDLASTTGTTAYRAVLTLARTGDRSLPFLREHLPPAPEPGAVARLVADLDDNRYAVREQAAHALAELPEQAEPALRATLAGRPSLELRRRAEAILQAIDQAQSPARLRAMRAVEVLEGIGTPAARHLLGTLAGGAPAARLTREAKASLERLAKRR